MTLRKSATRPNRDHVPGGCELQGPQPKKIQIQDQHQNQQHYPQQYPQQNPQPAPYDGGLNPGAQQMHNPYVYPPQQQGLSTSSSTTVTLTQPGAAPLHQVPIILPKNNSGLSWLACICFFPLGIAAVVASNRVDSSIAEGDYASAATYELWTRRFSTPAIAIGCFSIGLTISFIVLAVVW